MDINKLNDIFRDFQKVFDKTCNAALKIGLKSVTHTELHILEAIGEGTVSMNELSEKLDITMGTATVAINKLTEKGFIDRERSDKDRRKVFVSLTGSGKDALAYHDSYHEMIMSSITEKVPEKELKVFMEVYGKMLNSLKNESGYFRPLVITDFPVGAMVSIVEIKGTPIVQNYFADHGIKNFSILEVMEADADGIFNLKKPDGQILKLNVLDAKNLVGVKRFIKEK
ncbi:MarR family winged helix-turn-helix transcriptional regulator [Fusobacterium sp. PH5-44]|uniref:MarR family winged helix-turn-helix transcriptional regulator n=1 Tax=unclassified Fusobacterium TaxID=2648384 RepID=UPI003D1F5919